MITNIALALSLIVTAVGNVEKPTLAEVVEMHKAMHLDVDNASLPHFDKESAAPTVRVLTSGPFPMTVYSFGYCSISVDSQKGRVAGMFVGYPIEVTNARAALGPIRRKLTDRQIADLATRYYHLAGYEGEIDVFDLDYRIVAPFTEGDVSQFDYRDYGTVPGVSLRYVRKHKGVPYAPQLAGLMSIDPENGRLRDFYADSRDLPPVPSSVTPKVSREQALNRAAVRVLSDWDAVLAPIAVRSSLLCISGTGDSGAKIESPWSRDYRSAAEVRDDEGRGSRLVYLVTLVDPTIAPDQKGMERTYMARVDAASGKVLGVVRYPEVGGWGGGGKRIAVPALNRKGYWSLVAESGKTIPIGSASVKETNAAGPPRGKRLTLKLDKTFFSVRYDAGAKLLWVQKGDGTFKVGRPTGTLAKALASRPQ